MIIDGEYPGTNLIGYRVPLRDGVDAQLALPRNLTKAEARRLAAFMETLVAPLLLIKANAGVPPGEAWIMRDGKIAARITNLGR